MAISTAMPARSDIDLMIISYGSGVHEPVQPELAIQAGKCASC
jgi:hypothetical protein